MGEDVPFLSREELNKLIKKIESINGNRIQDFTLKEIMLMVTSDLKDEVREFNETLSRHIEKSDKETLRVNKFMRDHDVCVAKVTENLKHIVSELPEKGFCEKVNKTLYTEDGTDKVEVLWNDRRWIKGLFALALALIGLTGANLFILLG